MSEGTQNATNEVECPQCKERVTLALAKPEVVNSFSISAIVWAHPDPQRCPNCGLGFVMKIANLQGIGAQVAWVPVKTKEDSVLIVPPSARGGNRIVVPE